MQSEPQKEHAWFKQMVGRWTMEGEAMMGPDQPPMRSKGVETVSMLGDLWMVADGEAEMPGGQKGKMTMTLGYDPRKKRYVGTWVGSMMDLLFRLRRQDGCGQEGSYPQHRGTELRQSEEDGQVPGHHHHQVQGPSHADLARAGRGRQVDSVHDRALPAQENKIEASGDGHGLQVADQRPRAGDNPLV
jgi:hypothetical protein